MKDRYTAMNLLQKYLCSYSEKDVCEIHVCARVEFKLEYRDIFVYKLEK